MRFKTIKTPLSNRYHTIRHAQSDYNVKKTYAGTIDAVLTQEGIDATKQITLTFEPDLIFSSPLTRTTHTAKIIFGEGVELVIDNRLIERNGGVAQGMSFDQIAKKYPDDWDIWHTHTLKQIQQSRLPEGESCSDVVKRVEEFITQQELNHVDKDIVLVTHSGIILALRYLFGHSKDDIYLKAIDNSAIEVFGL